MMNLSWTRCLYVTECTYLHVYSYNCVYMNIHMYMYMYIYINGSPAGRGVLKVMNLSSNRHLYVTECTYLHVYVYMNIHMYMYIYICINGGPAARAGSWKWWTYLQTGIMCLHKTAYSPIIYDIHVIYM
jgi:hypothetical protein